MMKWELRGLPEVQRRGSRNEKKKAEGIRAKLREISQKEYNGVWTTICVSLWEFVFNTYIPPMKARWERSQKHTWNSIKNLTVGKSLSSLQNLCLPPQALCFLANNTPEHLLCLSIEPKSNFLFL